MKQQPFPQPWTTPKLSSCAVSIPTGPAIGLQDRPHIEPRVTLGAPRSCPHWSYVARTVSPSPGSNINSYDVTASRSSPPTGLAYPRKPHLMQIQLVYSRGSVGDHNTSTIFIGVKIPFLYLNPSVAQLYARIDYWFWTTCYTPMSRSF